MPRDPEKTKVGVWLSPDERKALAKTLEFLGVKTFADLARTLITASDWPQSRIDALARLFAAARDTTKDARAECVLVKLRPAEFQALAAEAEDGQLAVDEVVYDLIRRDLRRPPLSGAREKSAQTHSPLRPGDASPDSDSAPKLHEQALAGTIFALKNDPDGLASVERSLEGMRPTETPGDAFHQGYPSAISVREVIHALARLGADVEEKLTTQHLPNLTELRRAWARLLLGARSEGDGR
ncbi:hypothetical protein [Roseimicrobium sp. ORNL1]|uniref:hypothetical protein n=1 Tax=Roseimicrobium sp. ORNL1 TaxID=2711231 RepID=UPI0013E10A2A|nr:hypothetical protein [Roseimicrobium sp. ORNL1]QIF04311.1 hypothetical protein G5S37_23235 [Roseimicrobium sp. ORNL1]